MYNPSFPTFSKIPGKYSVICCLHSQPPQIRYSSNPLSITIPDIAFLTHNLPPPKLSIVDQAKMEIPSNSLHMECSTGHEDIEHASICETASVASDLTRMCVSDEDEKLMVVSDDEDAHTR